MKAEILATGTELLLGEIVDENSPYLANYLSRLGIDLYWISTVGDNMGRLTEALQRAWQRSELILTTGGLGPTQGDITRDAVSSLLGEELQVDPGEEQRLKEFFASRGWEMPASNIKQAMRIPSAQFLPNPAGTAPGWWVEKQGHIIVTLPGPPEEMHLVWENEVVRRLKQKLGGVVILSRVLKTFGISEAKIGESVGPLVASANPTLATYAKQDGIHLRITAKADNEATATHMLKGVEAQVRDLVGEAAIWGVDSDVLEGVVGKLLLDKRLTLSAMESCTGGLLAVKMTDLPGSSAYFGGGIVSYTDAVKIASGVDAALIRDHGAVSAEVAQSMASAVRAHMSTDIGVGITGVAGPSPLEGKPAGTVFIAIDAGAQTRVISRTFPGKRQRVRERATTSALFEIRKILLSR